MGYRTKRVLQSSYLSPCPCLSASGYTYLDFGTLFPVSPTAQLRALLLRVSRYFAYLPAARCTRSADGLVFMPPNILNGENAYPR